MFTDVFIKKLLKKFAKFTRSQLKGLLRKRLTEVGKIILENVLDLGRKTSPSGQTFCILSNFWNNNWGTVTGAFPWPSCYFFCKKWSNCNISSYYLKHKSMKFLSFKKVSEGQSDIHVTISYFFISYKLLFEIKKIDMRLSKTLNLKFMLMFFDSLSATSFRHRD